MKMNNMNNMIGELTGKEVAKEMDGVTKLLPTNFTHHAPEDAVKVITEEFKLDLKETYPDKRIVTNEENTKEK